VTQLGELSLWIALLMAAWCVTLATQGALLRREALVRSGARGLHAALFFVVLATAGLGAAFLGDDFSLRYVAMHSGANIGTFYKISAFGAGREGELLLASLSFAAAGSAALRLVSDRDRDRVRAAWMVAMLGLILAATLALTAFDANPFALVGRAPEDGRGLDPVLRNPAMLLQPPLMLLGSAAAAVPLALAIAASMRGRLDGWIAARLRASAVIAWGVLAAALLIGMHWADVSPGLRALARDSATVIASAIALAALSLVLVATQFRRSPRQAISEADLMRRRAGRVLAALGAALCIAVLAARPLARDYDAQIGDGERYRAKDSWGHEWTFTSQGASRMEREGNDVIALALLPTRDGVRQPFIASESRQYYGAGGLDIFPPQVVPGIRSTVAQDLYVVLADAGEGRAALRISFRPLVELGWTGGVLLALGGLLLFWPPRAEFSA
jgi:cytochrome c biogenesis factor